MSLTIRQIIPCRDGTITTPRSFRCVTARDFVATRHRSASAASSPPMPSSSASIFKTSSGRFGSCCNAGKVSRRRPPSKVLEMAAGSESCREKSASIRVQATDCSTSQCPPSIANKTMKHAAWPAICRFFSLFRCCQTIPTWFQPAKRSHHHLARPQFCSWFQPSGVLPMVSAMSL